MQRFSAFQLVRRVNLRRLLDELQGEGIRGPRQLVVLGLTIAQFAAIVGGSDITDSLAGQLEWAMNRPLGWLDRLDADRII